MFQNLIYFFNLFICFEVIYVTIPGLGWELHILWAPIMLYQKTFGTLAKQALDIRQYRATSDCYSLISNNKHIFFYYIACDGFFIKTSCKISRYIAINLIISITQKRFYKALIFIFVQHLSEPYEIAIP